MYKKLFITLTGILFVCNIASANVLCVKDKVANNDKIPLAKKIKVLATDVCPEGFTNILNLQTIVGPQGEKGDKGNDGIDGVNGKDGSNGIDAEDGEKGYRGDKGKHGVNFYDNLYYEAGKTLTGVISGNRIATVSLQLPSTLEIQIADPEECTGTYDEPTAPEGKVCIYPMRGLPKAQRIPTGNIFELNTKELCEGAGRIWTEPFCIANDTTGVAPVDSEANCVGDDRVWDEINKICRITHYGMVYCSTSINYWSNIYKCHLYTQGTLDNAHLEEINNNVNDAEAKFDCENTDNHYEQCDSVLPYSCEATNHRGEWHATGCSDPNLTDTTSCFKPTHGTWVEGYCSEGLISLDEKYSNAGFYVTSEVGEFAARWAFTAPDLDASKN